MICSLYCKDEDSNTTVNVPFTTCPNLKRTDADQSVIRPVRKLLPFRASGMNALSAVVDEGLALGRSKTRRLTESTRLFCVRAKAGGSRGTTTAQARAGDQSTPKRIQMMLDTDVRGACCSLTGLASRVKWRSCGFCSSLSAFCCRSRACLFFHSAGEILRPRRNKKVRSCPRDAATKRQESNTTHAQTEQHYSYSAPLDGTRRSREIWL